MISKPMRLYEAAQPITYDQVDEYTGSSLAADSASEELDSPADEVEFGEINGRVYAGGNLTRRMTHVWDGKKWKPLARSIHLAEGTRSLLALVREVRGPSDPIHNSGRIGTRRKHLGMTGREMRKVATDRVYSRLTAHSIRESTDDSKKWIEMSYEEFCEFVASQPGDLRAPQDIGDPETGEIYIEVGVPYKKVSCHPDYEPTTKPYPISREDEDVGLDDEVEPDVLGEFEAAVTEFVDNIDPTPVDADVDPQDVAPDLARGFFYYYADWPTWSRKLDMSKSEILNYVADCVYERLASA